MCVVVDAANCVRGEDRDPLVVGIDIRNAALRVVCSPTAADRHGGPACSHDGLGHARLVERRDDPLPRPRLEVGQPPRFLLFDIQAPIAHLTGVPRHALRDLAVVGQRRIDDHGHERPLGRSNAAPPSSFFGYSCHPCIVALPARHHQPASDGLHGFEILALRNEIIGVGGCS
jgi:hypothetical protein